MNGPNTIGVLAGSTTLLTPIVRLADFVDWDHYAHIFRFYKFKKLYVYFKNETAASDNATKLQGTLNMTSGAIEITNTVRHVVTINWCPHMQYGASYGDIPMMRKATGFRSATFWPSKKLWWKIGGTPKYIHEFSESTTTTAEVPGPVMRSPCSQSQIPISVYQFGFENIDPQVGLNIPYYVVALIEFSGKKASNAPN